MILLTEVFDHIGKSIQLCVSQYLYKTLETQNFHAGYAFHFAPDSLLIVVAEYAKDRHHTTRKSLDRLVVLSDDIQDLFVDYSLIEYLRLRLLVEK